MRFRDQDIVFAHGGKGQNLDIPSANPLNYFDVVSNAAGLPTLTIDDAASPDFARRINPRAVNKRVLESLAASGAFDSIEPDLTIQGLAMMWDRHHI